MMPNKDLRPSLKLTPFHFVKKMWIIFSLFIDIKGENVKKQNQTLSTHPPVINHRPSIKYFHVTIPTIKGYSTYGLRLLLIFIDNLKEIH